MDLWIGSDLSQRELRCFSLCDRWTAKLVADYEHTLMVTKGVLLIGTSTHLQCMPYYVCGVGICGQKSQLG